MKLATSGIGTTRTFRNVRDSVAVGCKADIEQVIQQALIRCQTVRPPAAPRML
jgi:hypothetical protein